MAAPTGAQLIAYGMTLRGTYGPPENVNKFTKAYYGDRTSASWCLIFVWYCLDHFGAASLIGGKIAYVPNLKGRVGGKWHTSKLLIREGDPVTFDFNRTGSPEHVGIFIKWLDSGKTRFQSIEGNTGDDLVATRTRYWSDVYGYVKPGLALPRPGTYPGVIYTYTKGRPLQTGSHVRWIQQHLAAHGHATKVDGKYGPDTAAAVKAFQQQTGGLRGDGEVGPVTWNALAK